MGEGMRPGNAACTALVSKAVKEYVGIVIGLSSILFVTVVIGTKLTEQVDFPQNGNGTDFLQQGLVVFYTVPTTISSGVVLTEQVIKRAPAPRPLSIPVTA